MTIHDVKRQRAFFYTASTTTLLLAALLCIYALTLQDDATWASVVVIFLAMAGLWLMRVIDQLDQVIQEFEEAVHPNRKSH